ncbi:MAG: flagellar hook-associated protein FlgL [Gracilimonas sp.]|uniref:flagellar hook-associated protein FlgL n=1 Tax=Gracilimonas TaxID=649462 RepID=UPI001B2A3A8A|nr:flagellar hook-associated protein FlgL [Gracilimonas sp.]MBO6586824.1 flagellar hook-associated protein FlgL [Gracilimonas sp.]MBO6614688.1 flagellar hook-associated protein FlgL [Gracilimonas sp.]
MRITQKTIFGNFMRDINKNRGEMAKIQSDLSSGKAVRVPSQDPVSFQRSRILTEDIRKEEQFQSNIESGLRQSRLAQDALDETIDRLIEIKEKVVQGASSSLGESNRASMADSISGIRDSLISTLNLSYGDRYLFAGTNSGEKPFELDGTAVGGVSNGSNNKSPKVQAGDGVNIDISVTGSEIRNTPAGDLFEVIGNIEQALRDNDVTALNNLLPDVDESIEHVTDVTSRLGNNINRMDFMFEQYEATRITKEADISRLVDTDYAEAFSDLQRIEVAYESAMAVHTTMFKNTLLDYL